MNRNLVELGSELHCYFIFLERFDKAVELSYELLGVGEMTVDEDISTTLDQETAFPFPIDGIQVTWFTKGTADVSGQPMGQS